MNQFQILAESIRRMATFNAENVPPYVPPKDALIIAMGNVAEAAEKAAEWQIWVGPKTWEVVTDRAS